MSIDYGNGMTNIDHTTGIRFGVIPSHELMEAWDNESEPNYGKPHCPHCGNEAIDCSDDDTDIDRDEYASRGCGDYACDNCKKKFDSQDAFPDEPHSFFVQDDEVSAEQSGDDHDIFILKSKFYTLCGYCSPCAPGAGYLTTPGTVRTYCFGHAWFEDGIAPYDVYSVETGEPVSAIEVAE